MHTDGSARVAAWGVRMIRNGLLDWSVMRPAASRAPRRPPPPLPDDPAGLSRAAVDSARARGFAAAGVLAASRPVSFERYRAWLEQGFTGRWRIPRARRRGPHAFRRDPSVHAIGPRRGPRDPRPRPRKRGAVRPRRGLPPRRPPAPEGGHRRSPAPRAPGLELPRVRRHGAASRTRDRRPRRPRVHREERTPDRSGLSARTSSSARS